jgi:hypothetical protein
MSRWDDEPVTIVGVVGAVLSTAPPPRERTFTVRGHSQLPTDMEGTVAIAAGIAQSGGHLDLSNLVHDKKAHAAAGRLLFLGWWLLGTARPPKSIILPTTVAARRVLCRFGVLFAAMRRNVPLVLDGVEVSVVAALRGNDRDVGTLPGFDWKNYDDLVVDRSADFLEDRSSRLRVITDLEDPARRPLAPNEDGRRYHWVDGLGASTTPGSARTRFYGDVDQVLYEVISNVHEWAEAEMAIAACSVTLGGGAESHNRLHIVVMDNGVGIPERVSRQRTERGLRPWEDDAKVRHISSRLGISELGALLHLIFDEAFGARSLEPIDHGHGLHSVGALAHQWTGTVNLFTAGPQGCSWMRRIGRDDWRFSDFPSAGCSGTTLHVTLEAPANAPGATGEPSHRDPVSVLST